MIFARPVFDPLDELKTRAQTEEGGEFLRAGLRQRQLIGAGDHAVVNITPEYAADKFGDRVVTLDGQLDRHRRHELRALDERERRFSQFLYRVFTHMLLARATAAVPSSTVEVS